MAEARQLSPYSETEYEHRAASGFPVSCPTLDLSVTWDANGRNLLIYRPPGQVVSKIHQVPPPGSKAPEALAVTWKPDGQFLAVGWSDGYVRLMGLENSKAAHHIKISEDPNTRITHIGWARTALSNSGNSVVPDSLQSEIKTTWNLDGADRIIDLPRELTFLEIDSALPKLSPLPSSSAGSREDATVFTLRNSMDFLFQQPKPEELDDVDVMVVGTSDSNLHLSIYDSFVIGTFPYHSPGPSTSLNLIYHASHPHLSSQCLVLADKLSGPSELALVPMDLPFITSSPISLSLLASKLTTLQKLLRYLKQTQLHMQVEWKNARELPSRFLRSVEGDLETMPSGPRDIVAALYHTVVTGHAYEPVKEWLVDSLAERGHKRWDKAVVSGLEALRSLVHENFLPVLERCAIIFSRLRGLAQFYDNRDDIGFSVTQINRAMDIISCLTLVGHRILVLVMDELDHFTVFSTWLRFQIDRLASSSSAGDELTEKEATMDNAKVLTYIGRYLTKSPLDVFFDEIAQDDYSSDWEHIEDGPSLLDILDRQLKRRDDGQASMKALPHVDFLVNYLTSRSNRIFQDIADANKRSVRFGKEMKLSIGQPITHYDVKVSSTKRETGIIYAALASEENRSKVHLFRSGMSIYNGISSNHDLSSCCIDIGPLKLVDLKFQNDEILLLICTAQDNTTSVISIPIQADTITFSPYNYNPTSPASGAEITSKNFPSFTLPPEQTIRPVRMEAHDACDVRGHIPPRICLLGSNRTTVKTFAFPE